MMMHPQVPAQQPKQLQIPQHVLDRLEDEWRQMRDNAAPQPRLQAAE
ncbi:hypothetical protein LH464_10070 [Neorhizobium sp. T786]|nr:hypothetical protein [Neorhizobium xiangyangii]MCB5202819.1 hypothetical protein [Neorhizobium xiangyangii]